MHQLAIALHKKGHSVSGSDDDIFDPARSNLKYYGLLPEQTGWFSEKINKNTDAVILGMHARKNNPELLRAQELNIPIYSFPQYIYEIAKDKTRVVIAGSHGKTTITSMIIHCLQYHKQKFDYLVGAKLRGFEQSVHFSEDAPIMIIEGDEYLSSPLDLTPKFHFYKADIALISGIAWDHINVFPTFENYLNQFRIFINTLSPKAHLVYNQHDNYVKKLAEENDKIGKTAYGDLPDFDIKGGRYIISLPKHTKIPLKIFGEHNLQNLMGAKAVCEQLNISETLFWEAMQHFEGAAKRLELLGENEHTAVYKDFAHAPSKVKATVKAMKSLHPERSLFACLELHTYSSLNKNFLPHYKNTLDPAETAVVFYDQHAFDIKKLPFLDKKQVAEMFAHRNLKVITDKKELMDFLQKHTTNYKSKDVLFMSSGNFGGINWEEIVQEILQ